jgi:hypothetical protein
MFHAYIVPWFRAQLCKFGFICSCTCLFRKYSNKYLENISKLGSALGSMGRIPGREIDFQLHMLQSNFTS